MKDHYRPQKMALWMNLIPDLQSAAIANQVRRGKIALAAEAAEATDEAMLDYRLFFFRPVHIFSYDKSKKGMAAYVFENSFSLKPSWFMMFLC